MFANGGLTSRAPPLYLEKKTPHTMAALIEAIDIKRRTVFEFENTPFSCMDAEISTPTARGGQTLVRLKMRNLLTSAVSDKTFGCVAESMGVKWRSNTLL